MGQNNEDNKRIDISGALHDSSNSVEFEEEQRPVQYFSSEKPKIIRWVMKYSGGLVKDEKQANYVLLAFVALSVVISLFLIFGGRQTAKNGGVNGDMNRGFEEYMLSHPGETQ